MCASIWLESCVCQPADEEQEEPEDAASFKENRQQNSNPNTASAEPKQSGSSAKSSRGTSSPSGAVVSKTRKSARLSDSGTSSATQDSASQAGPQEPAPQGFSTHNSAGQTIPAQLMATQSSASMQEAGSTPVKAQQAKPADDLEKLLGSRLKSVQPQGELRQREEAAASPVAALRGQLRRVKLEPEEASSPTARPRFESVAGRGSDSPAQVSHAATVSAWY